MRTADAATLGRLRPVWASYRLPLPEAIPYLVEVQFEDDPDAPAFAYPPCSVLSKSGLDPVHTRLDSSAVQAVLARVRGGPRGGARDGWHGIQRASAATAVGACCAGSREIRFFDAATAPASSQAAAHSHILRRLQMNWRRPALRSGAAA